MECLYSQLCRKNPTQKFSPALGGVPERGRAGQRQSRPGLTIETQSHIRTKSNTDHKCQAQARPLIKPGQARPKWAFYQLYWLSSNCLGKLSVHYKHSLFRSGWASIFLSLSPSPAQILNGSRLYVQAQPRWLGP